MEPLLIVSALAIIPVVIALYANKRVTKVILSVVGFIGFLLLSVLCAAFVLPYFIGFHGTWLGFVLCGEIFVIFMLFVFKPFKEKPRRITAISLAGLMVVLGLIFIVPPVYRDSIPRAVEELDLSDYEPFGEYRYKNDVLTLSDSSAATLNEESTLKLDGELPRLDGATALYPLYSAFVRATYPEPEPAVNMPEYSHSGDLRSTDPKHLSYVVCSTTPFAFENLIDGYADIAFLMGVSDEQRKIAGDKGLELFLTPIGREAFVFFVNSRNAAQNLSTEDVRRIYSGEVTNWSEVGGGNDKITAYQRPDESGSQTMLKQIMGDTPLVSAPTDEIFSTMMGMYERIATYRNYKNSLGYSFLYYIRDMIGENKVKFLSIDGIAPTPENIANSSYPFSHEIYAVTVRKAGEYLNPERTENTDKFIEWIKSTQGQYLVNATGYQPID
jgi:phosphate transport system substrate-binding protein